MNNIEIKLLGTNNTKEMKEIIEDDNMIFSKANIINFINKAGNYGFIIIFDNKIVGFSYGYGLLRPDGKKMLYIHSVGLLKEYQNKGLGSMLMKYIVDYGKNNGFSESFVITNKGNLRACKVYEKVGFKNDIENEIVYVLEYDKSIKD
ncbi:MAG TPA: GNAT family N-acetyltransferase [Bacilli bacterium]|nr:GNAT family N-acetyltransferase [Bacilli bacterium]